MPLPARLLRRVRLALAGVAALSLAAGLAVATDIAPTRDDGTAQSVAADPVRTRTTYRLVGTAVASTVATGRRIRITGSVATRSRTAQHARPITLAERRAGRWHPVARTRSTRVGAYAFTIPTGATETTHVFRVRAPRSHGLPAATGRPIRVRVVKKPKPTPTTPPTPTPPTPPPPVDLVADPAEALPAGYVGAGSATDWTYLFSGGGRWSPCAVIRWAYDPAGQKYAALADVQRAFAKIAGASGLRFTYVGPTDWRYVGTVSGFPSTQADIVVGWADATELPGLAGNVVGIGGGSGTRAAAGSGVAYRITKGYLTLDNGHVLPTGFDRSGWGQIMLHEVLHALGLGHAATATQLMYGTASSTNVRFGAGDLTGISRIGAAAGCLS